MRAGAAVSREEDVRLAARDAATRALDAAGIDQAACLLVAATPEHLDESIELCEELRDAAGAGTQIVGGATSAAFCPGDADIEEGPALGVLALEQRAHLFSFRADMPEELRGAAARAGPGALGIVFADPAAPLQRLLGALGREAPKARFAGGGVAVEGGLLLDHDLADVHAVGAFFPAPARVAVAQSHQPIGQPLLVTRSEGRSLIELDSHPAVEALAALAEQPGLSGEALQFVALGLSPRPGEPFRDDDFLSVQLLGVDEERGSLETGIPVPEGHSVTFTLRDGMGARRTLQSALDRLGSAPPEWGVYFDCASRGSTLYGVDGLDLDLIGKSLGSFPLLSLRTSFELGPSGGGVGVHLFTGVLALGDSRK
jgi:small ligand-binding sensory domain FIST